MTRSIMVLILFLFSGEYVVLNCVSDKIYLEGGYFRKIKKKKSCSFILFKMLHLNN